MLPINALSSDILLGFYSAKRAQSAAASPSGGLSTTSPAVWSTAGVTTPWDRTAEQRGVDERLTEVLKGNSLIDESKARLSNPTANETEQKLFTLYSALNTLSSLASKASEKSTSATLLNSYNKRFQDALNEILAYGNTVVSDDVTVLTGEKNSRVTTETTVPKSLSQHTTKIVHNKAITEPMNGLTGNEVFTIQVKKSSGTTDVVVDLSELGTPNVLIDDVIGLINSKLQAAGSVSRFKRERVVDPNAEKDPDKPPPQTWALKIEGTPTEKLSFSAASTGTAVYLAGTAGKPGETIGQFLKLDVSGATPKIAGADRIEGDLKQEETVRSNGVALDSQGNSYVISTTDADVGNLMNQGTKDVVLTKYDSSGNVAWRRMLGASGTAEGYSVTVDASDNVLIAGKADGSLTGAGTGGTSNNAFVTKFDSQGEELFTRHLGPFADDGAMAVTTDSVGNIYFGGYTRGAVSGSVTHGGGEDAFITKLDADGTLVYSRQYGASGNERLTSLDIDDSGNLVALSQENGHAVVRSFSAADGSSAELWSRDLGDLSGGEAPALKATGGKVYIGGYTDNGGFGGGTTVASHHGGTDGFVVELDGASGSVNSTTFVGAGSTDRIRALDVVGGNVYVTGDTTSDLGGGFSGSINSFAAQLDGAGGFDWVHQFAGRNGQARSYGIAVDQSGSSVLDALGLPKGDLDYAESRTVTAQSSVRDGDYFYLSVDGGAKRKITIEQGDTLNNLKLKINKVLLFNGQAASTTKSGGTALKITPAEGRRIDLYAGEEDKDALAGLGLTPGTLISNLPGTDDKDSEAAGHVFISLALNEGLNLSTKEGAANAAKQLLAALSKIRNGYRTLTTPVTERRGGGDVPAYLSAQMANYQAGLARLSAGGTDGGFGFFL